MPLIETYKRRLPLYGPLTIKNPADFLVEAKKTFAEGYLSPFPYQVQLRNFQLIHLLGEGAFGKVILVRYKVFNSYYAMKALSKSYLVKVKHVQQTLNEKRILQSMNCPFCVRLEYFSQDNSYIYFFLPFVCGGEMFTHLQKVDSFSEELSRFYAAQVVLGLQYLHELGLVYRDLKPENLLIDHFGYLKITDFGFTKIVSSRTYTFCGTPDYIAPEIILGQGYGKAVDWWALGVLIFEMNNGFPPFHSTDSMDNFDKIVENDYEMPKSFGEDLQDIIIQLLQPNASKRLGNLQGRSQDIQTHRWFKNTNWLMLLNRTIAAPFVPKNAEVVNTTYFPGLKPCPGLRISDVSRYSDYFKDF